MKNHRFPWLRNRTTDNRKCEKARNIKEKRTIEMFSTVSKQLVALRSSASDNETSPRDNRPRFLRNFIQVSKNSSEFLDTFFVREVTSLVDKAGLMY